MTLSEGIIVKNVKYQENSKLITILTESGLSTYLVRGGANYKNHNFSYSNELTKIGFDFKQKSLESMKILASGTILNNYSNIKTSFDKLNDAIIILESINLLGDHINDFKTLYNFVDAILTTINNQSYNSYYLIIYRLKLLFLLGIGPIFTKCVNCNKHNNLKGFVLNYGGMVCIDCMVPNLNYYVGEIVEVMKILYLTKVEKITEEFINLIPDYKLEISKFLDQYYGHFISFNSRANKIIEKMK